MYIYYNDRFLIERNWVTNYGAYGVYIYYGNYQGGASSSRATLRNNFIGGTLLNSTTPYGIYVTTNTTNVDFFHNSVSLVAGNGRCIYILSGSGNDVRNNSFSVRNSTTGWAAYVSSTAYVTNMDYNNYYAPGSSNFLYLSAPYSQSTYIGGAGFNANSKDGDPNYINPASDLHAFAAQLFDGGDPVVGVNSDYDNDLRPNPFSTIPDIGADEYMPDTIDIAPITFLTPANNICPDSQQVVSVIISNKGLNSITNIPMTANVTGALTATLTATYTDTLDLGESDTVLLGTLNTWPGGVLNFEVYSAVPGDQTLSNDTLAATRNINLTPAAPAATNDTVCAGDSTMLVASSTGTNYWYDAPFGGTVLANADTLHTGPLNTNTTYYVEAKGVASNSLETTFANNNSCGGGNMFEITAYNEITVDSFDLNMNAGTVNVDVYYKVGTFTGFETTGAAWTLLGSGSATSTGTGIPTRLAVGGLTIPAGQTYAIYIYATNMVYTTLTVPTNYTNSDMNLLAGVGLCSLFGGTNNPRGWNGRVYYTAEGCASPRTPVSVAVNPVPAVSIADTSTCSSLTLDAGAGGATYTWSTGDSTQTIVANASGTYNVTVSSAAGCYASDSAAIVINTPATVNLGNDQLLCDGASSTLDAGNTPGSSFAWSTGDTTQTIVVSAAGNYTVAVTTLEGCVTTDTLVATTLNSPSGSFVADTSGCPTIAFTGANAGGTASATSWDFGDGNTATGSTANHTYTANGTYNVTYVLANDCGGDTVTVPVTIACLVGTTAPNGTVISLYPNPTNGFAALELQLPNTTETEVAVTDITGKIIFRQNQAYPSGKSLLQIDLSKASAGIYLVHVTTEGLKWQGKLVKN
jgi:hypothetical protein